MANDRTKQADHSKEDGVESASSKQIRNSDLPMGIHNLKDQWEARAEEDIRRLVQNC